MNNKLNKLREILKKQKFDGLLVPMRDEFGSEYVPPQYQRLKYITGFTGSNGFAVVLKNKAAFFTDSRYTLQSKLEIDKKQFVTFDLSEKNEGDWLAENGKNLKIGFDPKLFTIAQIKKYQEKFEGKNIKLIETETNLIDEIWEDRPKPDKSEVFILDKKFTGKTAQEKIREITKNLKADNLLLTNSESICWLLNIRARDIPTTPVLLSYAVISRKCDITIYTSKNAIDEKLKSKILPGISVKNLGEIFKDIKKYKGSIQLCTGSTPYIFKSLIGKIVEGKDPCIILRAVKNKTEIENIKQAHVKDGVALLKFFYWLKNNINKNLTEYSIAEVLENFRKQNKNFLFPSFDTIAGYAENGAIIHYRASEKSAKKLKAENILLLDSGGQYLDGTTDVTRVIALGKISEEQKRNFTLVLKGHIAIAAARFPKGTSGAQIDVLARMNLWNEGLDYKHGTGHGVGFCLNVHEGPHGISKHYFNMPLEAGMVISNEPGYYKEGAYGIRIENLVFVKESKFKGFLELETLTQVPIDINLIDKKLLSKNELDWLNRYHENVYKKLSSAMNKDEKQWLRLATRKI